MAYQLFITARLHARDGHRYPDQRGQAAVTCMHGMMRLDSCARWSIRSGPEEVTASLEYLSRSPARIPARIRRGEVEYTRCSSACGGERGPGPRTVEASEAFEAKRLVYSECPFLLLVWDSHCGSSQEGGDWYVVQ